MEKIFILLRTHSGKQTAIGELLLGFLRRHWVERCCRETFSSRLLAKSAAKPIHCYPTRFRKRSIEVSQCIPSEPKILQHFLFQVYSHSNVWRDAESGVFPLQRMRISNLFGRLRRWLVNYNLYIPDENDYQDDDVESTDAATTVKQQIYSTWIYVLLLTRKHAW